MEGKNKEKNKEINKEENVTYILKCADNTLYTGWSNHIQNRIKQHNLGKGAKYTRPEKRRPVQLVYLEKFETKEEAMRREWEIKQLSRKEKLKLISEGKASL